MNVALRFLALVVKILDVLVAPIFWLRARGKKQRLPPITEPLIKLSATELAAKIRKREVSCEHVCIVYIKRIKEVNPILNAVVEERFESALEEARNVDAFLKTSPLVDELEVHQPLLGVPVTVKESCALVGLSFSTGTLGRAGIKADCDGEAVARVKASGAIPLLVSNIPEICLSWDCTNFITGTTNNPYDTTRTSSGSSGGEGALLGSGASVIGIGSDVAGSIRLPAMFNGVFGHKPTARIIPIKGHYPYCQDELFKEYFVIGPMARCAKDLMLMTKVMSGNLPELRLDEPVDLTALRVFFMTEEDKNSICMPRVQEEIKVGINKGVEYLRTKHNCQIVSDYKFEDLKYSLEIGGSALFKLKDAPNLLKGEHNHNLFVEICKSMLGLSKFTFNLLTFYLFRFFFLHFVGMEEYCRRNDYLRQLLVEQLGENGVLLYPTFPHTAFRHKSLFFKTLGIPYLMIVNTTGLPSTNVPCGFDKNGLPVGFQIIAAPNQDRLCLAVAEELEKCFGGWIPPS